MEGKTIIVPIESVCFDKNTITLQLPDGFWNNHKVRCGSVTISIDDGLVEE